MEYFHLESSFYLHGLVGLFILYVFFVLCFLSTGSFNLSHFVNFLSCMVFYS